jgi:heme-degrading monooxygenase HmoA
MTQTKGMIVRTWSATADAAGAGNYSRYFDVTLLPELRTLPGFNGACLLRRDVGEDGTIELTTHTFWESAEAIRAFAGDDITVSVVGRKRRRCCWTSTGPRPTAAWSSMPGADPALR